MDLRFALLLVCFLLSGFAALLYQTVWSRELSFVFGTSELAVAVVLAAYMGGLALGAAAAGRWVHRIRRPVLAYGVLEAAIALCALAVPLGVRGLDALYVELLGGRDVLTQGIPPAALLFQLAGAFLLLLPPTAFMGATLPLLARHAVHREEQIAGRVGVLYAINTAGAIAGTLCAAFWLMPELGLRRTVWVGACVNAAVFALASLLARGAAEPEREEGGTAGAPLAQPKGSWVLPAILVSGVVSFGYEVLWTRLLSQLLGGSVQAFATMLASFLLGIALGSAAAARLGRTRETAGLGFAAAQLGIAVSSYATFALAGLLPALASLLGASSRAAGAGAVVAVCVLLPVTLCIGATFPFAVRILADRPEQSSAVTARVYAWNTVGAIFGALCTGFVLLPELGFEGTVAAGVATSLVLAAVASLAARPRRIGWVALAAVGGLLLAVFPTQPPMRLLEASPMSGERPESERVFVAVGRSATVLVERRGHVYHLTTNGLPESSIDAVGLPPRGSVAQWMGALPAWLRPDAREILVVGLGGGVALELLPSQYDAVHVIELEPQVVAANRLLQPLRARDPLSDPRVKLHIGDARGTLQLARRRFDAIVSQPSHPWTAGASHLYTREFFELVRSRLAPDGVFVQWIGLRFVDEALLTSLLAALDAAFTHVEVFAPQGNGLLFVGSQAPVDLPGVARRALRDAPAELGRFGLHSLEDFASRWALTGEGVKALVADAPANSDDHNFLATRSASLRREERMDPARLTRLLAPHDPLRSDFGLEFSKLVRAMLGSVQIARATRLAEYRGGADEAVTLGWIALSRGRSGKAARHFRRALELKPGFPAARDGLLLSRHLPLLRGEAVPGVSDAPLDPPRRALIEAWRAARRDDWQAVEELDPLLAGFEPSDPLFVSATRVRVEGRLERGGREQGREAMDMAEVALTRRASNRDLLLYARTAVAAGDDASAFGVLRELIQQAKSPRKLAPRDAQALAQRVLDIAHGLPAPARAELQAAVGLEPRVEVGDDDERTTASSGARESP